MDSNKVRRVFLDYFAERGHREVSSSSLVPEKDPTLLFANAGMNQFKNTFLGKERRDYSRATTCQKCVRAGGKHNDLENVGRTARHHTFFEMLGNFSFGDYFKEDAISFAWDLVTRVYGIDGSRLYATVYQDDDEAFGIWKRIADLPDSRILRLGEKDNFWAMGDTGPCGPCSEILVDLGRSPEGHTDCPPTCECGRYLEIWNLVFMQYERDEAGNLNPLPRPSIDTGMGLERITSVLQGKFNNFDTDLFQPYIQAAAEMAGISYGDADRSDVSLRIIADHARSGAFLVTDGVIPSNEGRGYVLRKILRRAIRHGKMLGLHEPFLYTLCGLVAEHMGEVYPELLAARDYVARVIRTEEEKFSSTLEFGLRKLEEVVPAGDGPVVVKGEDVFRLYDTYGFPLDLLQEIADEKRWTLDIQGFEAELEAQKERARASWKGESQKTLGDGLRDVAESCQSEFVGYETLVVEDARVMAILRDEQSIESLAEGEEGEVLLDRTPFYAESGGQMGDHGYLRGEGKAVRVDGAHAPVGGLVLLRVHVAKGGLKVGDVVRAEVDERRRFATACNHTATHLLQAALRDVLGQHVKQAGSLVAPDRLRFDFSHFAAVSPRELEIIEEMVNERVWKNLPVTTDVMNVEDAVRSGAMALFGEKYSEQVRVVTVEGFSRELCGGTHLRATGQMGLFKIVSESSIASGVRRIEAVTGQDAFRRFVTDERLLTDLERDWKVEPQALPGYIENLHEENRKAQKEVERLRLKLAGHTVAAIAEKAVQVGSITAASGVVTDVDRNTLRILADQLLRRFGSAVVALGAEIEGKASLVVMSSEDVAKTHPAGKIVGALAAVVGGGGGGRPNMAEAGGKDPSRLEEAMAKLPGLLG